MGIDIEAKLIYGCNYADLPEEILDEVDEMLYNGELDCASPWYDSGKDSWIVGVEVYINGLTPDGAKNRLDEAWEGIPRILKEAGAISLYVSAHVS